MTKTPNDFFTQQQVCDYLQGQICISTLRTWRKKGKENCGPPFIRIGKKKVLYLITDVKKWALRRNPTKPTKGKQNESVQRKLARKPKTGE